MGLIVHLPFQESLYSEMRSLQIAQEWKCMARGCCRILTGRAPAVGSFEVARSSGFGDQQLRSEHSQPGNGVLLDMMVALADDGRMIRDRPELDIYTFENSISAGIVNELAQGLGRRME
jgi:hypothetical protein